jgi:hypothetical protein
VHDRALRAGQVTGLRQGSDQRHTRKLGLITPRVERDDRPVIE